MPPWLTVVAGGVFAGHQPEVAHELAGGGEAFQVAQFGHQRRRVKQGHAAQTHQGFDHRLPPPPFHHAGQLLFVAGQPLAGFGDDVDHFLEEELLFGEGHFDRAQVAQVRGAPGGLAGVAQVVAEQKHFELLAGAVLLLLHLVAGADQIAHGFVLWIGHVDGGQFAGAVEAGQLVGIAAVGLDAVARLARNLGGRHEDAPVPVRTQEAARDSRAGRLRSRTSGPLRDERPGVFWRA